MKINEASHPMPGMDQSRKAAGKGKGARAGKAEARAVAPASFAQALTDQAEQRTVADLEELLRELTEQGQELARQQTFDSMETFRRKVQAFIDKVVHGLYKLQLASPPDALKNRRVNAILLKVDDQMEQIARVVLAHNAPALEVLVRVDQIRGLLCDLYK